MLPLKKTVLSGWGRHPIATCDTVRPEAYSELAPVGTSLLGRGLGRSYGDASLNPAGTVLLTERLNRLQSFDGESGLLHAEPGVTLSEILDVFVPRGWFPVVTPGTKYVTLGGCVAADVHGKNHHVDGTFGTHVGGFDLITASGQHLACSPSDYPEFFWATVGGMGLTGLIGDVTLKLRPVESAYILARHLYAGTLKELLEYFEDPSLDDHYSVAWVDCLSAGDRLGRGVFMVGHHAARDELRGRARKDPFRVRPFHPANLPMEAPGWLVNERTGRGFNSFYLTLQSRKKEPFLLDYNAFFYPLDRLGGWNRLYGPQGFLQYQCVIGREASGDGIPGILGFLKDRAVPSYLAVLKRFGPGNPAPLSFPTEGYTLALDIPVKTPGLFAALDRLDEMVLEYGGRVYLAKDCRLSATTFRAMYPRYPEWLEVKRKLDPQNLFTSSLAGRLEIGTNE